MKHILLILDGLQGRQSYPNSQLRPRQWSSNAHSLCSKHKIIQLNFFFQSIVMCCVKDEKRRSKALERLLENSRVMYWFGIASKIVVI